MPKGNQHMPPVNPSLTVTASGGVGGTLRVQGQNFIPSEGGQMSFLWIGYPGDYCVRDANGDWVPGEPCHGFYNNPVVAADGTFDVTFTNACLQAGTGSVAATQYDVKRDKWLEVDRESYTV